MSCVDICICVSVRICIIEVKKKLLIISARSRVAMHIVMLFIIAHGDDDECTYEIDSFSMNLNECYVSKPKHTNFHCIS